MKAAFQLIVAIAVVAAACGCTTIYSEGEGEADLQASELASLRQDVQRLADRTAGIAADQDDLHRQIDRLRAETSGGDPALRQRVDALERSVQALDTARAADRQYIVDEMKKILSGKTMQSSAPAAAGPQEGYEHVVAAGETLSQIAAAYKVTPAAIVKANNLKNPDSIRLGQKLFIPR